jgi:hypothetical protein
LLSVTVPAATDARPGVLGNRNVVVPSPAPQAVPIAANRSEYVVRLITLPSQSSHPDGAVGPAKSITLPIGMAALTAVSSVVKLVLSNAPQVSRLAPTVGSVSPKFGVVVI